MQHMPQKRAKYGLKLFIIDDYGSGVMNIIPYTGKENNAVHRGFAQDVVMKLLDPHRNITTREANALKFYFFESNTSVSYCSHINKVAMFLILCRRKTQLVTRKSPILSRITTA